MQVLWFFGGTSTNANKPGVYIFITDDNTKPLYIGKCEKDLGNRIWYHLGRIDNSNKDIFPYVEDWIKRSREKLCFLIIPVDPSWLAPALESFLIGKLNPIHNGQSKE